MNLGFIFFSQSEESTSVFLNSISDSVVTYPENEEFENTAFEILSEIHTYLSSPSLDQEVIDALSFELPKAVARFSSASKRCISVSEGIIDRLMESFIGLTDGDRAVGSQSLILQLNGSCVVVVAWGAGQCKVSVEGTKLGVRLLLLTIISEESRRSKVSRRMRIILFPLVLAVLVALFLIYGFKKINRDREVWESPRLRVTKHDLKPEAWSTSVPRKSTSERLPSKEESSIGSAGLVYVQMIRIQYAGHARNAFRISIM